VDINSEWGQIFSFRQVVCSVVVTGQIATATNGFWDAGTGGACGHFHRRWTARQLFLTDGEPNESPLLLRMATDCSEGRFV
jgi:hypothetical protein